MSFEPIYDVAVTLFRTKYDVAMQRNFNVTCHVNSTKVRRRCEFISTEMRRRPAKTFVFNIFYIFDVILTYPATSLR